MYTNRISKIYLESIRSVFQHAPVIWNSGSWGSWRRRRGAADHREVFRNIQTSGETHVHGQRRRFQFGKAGCVTNSGEERASKGGGTCSQPVVRSRKCLQNESRCILMHKDASMLLRNRPRDGMCGQRENFKYRIPATETLCSECTLTVDKTEMEIWKDSQVKCTFRSLVFPSWTAVEPPGTVNYP